MTVDDVAGLPIARPPGRPRSERAEKAIIEATIDLLVEEGVSGVGIEAVAARAGVGKTTIYRRWANKEALIIDALVTLKKPIPELAGVSVRDDLCAIIGANRPGDRRYDCVWNIVSGSGWDTELVRRAKQEIIEPRRQILRETLLRGVRTGELRAGLDVEVVMALMVGAVTAWARVLGPGEELPDDFADRVVDATLTGCLP